MKHLLFLFLLLACGRTEFEVYQKLEGLRILAIHADTPEINNASTVTLTPYMSFVKGGDTTLDIDIVGCPDPGIAYGAEVNCDDAPSALKVSSSTTFNTSTLGSANFYTGGLGTFPIVITPTIFATMMAAVDEASRFNGINYIVIFNISDQNSSASLKAVKRISLTSKTSGLNTNPSITGSILADGANLTSFPGENVELSVASVTGPENYQLQTADGLETLDENQFLSWFSSEGDIQFSRTDTDESVDYEKSGTNGVFVVVLHDGRGGLDIEIVPLP